MNCNKCGAPLVENDQFCRNCGAAVNEINTQNVVNNNYQQNNNYRPNNNKAPNNGLMNVAIAVAVIVIIALVAAIAFILIDKNGITINSGISNESIDTNNDVQSDNEKDTTPVKNKSTYKVKSNGFEFKVPTDLIYEKNEKGIMLGNEDDTWAANIEVGEGNYNKMSSGKSKIQSFWAQKGINASTPIEKEYGNVPCITMELSDGGQNILFGIVKANSMNMFAVTLLSIDNEFDYDVFEELVEVLGDAEYTGKTNEMNALDKIDLTEVLSLAK